MAWITCLAVVLALPLLQRGAMAIPADGIEIAPPTRVERFNPDQQVCRAEAIRAGYASQMRPWADQPAAVQARLREIQLEMTRDTLRRCVSKGLMDRSAAEQLFAQLIAEPASPAPATAAPTGNATPAPTPAPVSPDSGAAGR